jgi:DNA-directed RNA polymerase alpha subunit
LRKYLKIKNLIKKLNFDVTELDLAVREFNAIKKSFNFKNNSFLIGSLVKNSVEDLRKKNMKEKSIEEIQKELSNKKLQLGMDLDKLGVGYDEENHKYYKK